MLHFTFQNIRAFYGWPRGLGLKAAKKKKVIKSIPKNLIQNLHLLYHGLSFLLRVYFCVWIEIS